MPYQKGLSLFLGFSTQMMAIFKTIAYIMLYLLPSRSHGIFVLSTTPSSLIGINEHLSWFRNGEGCQVVERYKGLDTALYKICTFTFTVKCLSLLHLARMGPWGISVVDALKMRGHG